MADDGQGGGQDRLRINLHQDYEIRDWARKFGVSADELRKAAVGSEARKVEEYLKPHSEAGTPCRF